jgi:hypothetical protein
MDAPLDVIGVRCRRDRRRKCRRQRLAPARWSGLRIHTPSQPRSGRNSRSHRIDPARKAKVLLQLTNETGISTRASRNCRTRREMGAWVKSASSVSHARGPLELERTSISARTHPRPHFSQMKTRSWTPALPADRGQALTSAAFPNPTMTIGTSASTSMRDYSSVGRRTARCASINL